MSPRDYRKRAKANGSMYVTEVLYADDDVAVNRKGAWFSEKNGQGDINVKMHQIGENMVMVRWMESSTGVSRFLTKDCVTSQTQYLYVIFATNNTFNSLHISADWKIVLYKGKCYLL